MGGCGISSNRKTDLLKRLHEEQKGAEHERKKPDVVRGSKSVPVSLYSLQNSFPQLA